MKKEKVVLAFIAAIIGLLVAGILFYIYQSTKTISPSTPPSNIVTQQKDPSSLNIFVNISKPTDEDVIETKVVEIAGKTKPDATVIVLTPIDEEIVSPSADGNFSTTVNIEDGQNIIEITAIAKNGEQIKVIKTVTFSTEKF